MHIQAPVPGWADALPFMPVGGLVLAVDNGGVLVEAKQRNPGVTTALRHFVPDQQFGRDKAERLAIARAYFKSFIDGTYYEKYAQAVDLILEYNEYTDEGMLNNDPDVYTSHFQQAVAMANVWNEEYRPRLGSRLVLCNGPVGNSIDRRFAELAISTDNVLGYHPYVRASVQQWPGVVRDPGDWRYHSGRWNFMEQAWGLRPRWAFTEYGPYMGSTEGWRHASVLGGNQALLFALHRAWHLNMQGTDAYKTGRATTPAWFSIGGNWTEYLLEAPQIVGMAKISGELWHPGTGEDVDEQIKKAIREHAQAIIALVDPPKHTLRDKTNQEVINLFATAFGKLPANAPPYIAAIGLAGLNGILPSGTGRLKLYTGAAIEDLPGLTAAQKAKLIAAL